MDTLEQAYKSAIAVLTAPVSFLEWTTLKVESADTPDPRNSDDWSPIGLSIRYRAEDYTWDVAQTIEGERYIYAFSRRQWSNDVPTLVEELRLAADGKIHAAQMGARRFPDSRPLDGKDSPLPQQRQWNEIGTTMRFVRRLRGSRMSHYFFASRIPLSRHFLEELRTFVDKWVPETQFDDIGYVPASTSSLDDPAPATFGDWDPNVFTGPGGTLQVPVLDPITIALHLHDLALSASDDLQDYTMVYEGQNEKKRERVVKRQQKFMLASVVQMVLKNYDTGVGANKHDVSAKTNNFLFDYRKQIEYRIQEAERWWKYLSNWYQSGPIEFLSRVHFEHADDNRFSYFLPMSVCLLGANASEAGRDLLAGIANDEKKWPWLRHAVLPKLGTESEEFRAPEKYQFPRKFAFLYYELFVELGPHLHDPSTQAMWRVLSANNKRYELLLFIGGTPLDENPLAAAKKFSASHEKLEIKVPRPEEIVAEWHELASPGYTAKHEKFIKHQIWNTLIEGLDLVLSFCLFLDDRTVEHGFTLARSTLDFTAVLIEFGHGARGTTLLAKLFPFRYYAVAVAALIEGGLAIKSRSESATKHDLAGVASADFTIAGAAVTVLGVAAFLTLGLSTSPFFAVGFLLMGIGAIVGFFKDDPMDTFLRHCAFGQYGLTGGGGEIVKGLEEMKADEYGQQLEVLINLICRFKFGTDAARLDGRKARVTMGWIPEGAKLIVDYWDEWQFGREWFEVLEGTGWGAHYSGEDFGSTDKMTRTFDFGQGGVVVDSARQFDIMLSKARFFAPAATGYPDFAFRAHFKAQLHLTFGDSNVAVPVVVPPKPLEFEIHEWMLGANSNRPRL